MLNFSQKLYLGFSVVIVLLALVGSTAYFALSNASNGFEEYRSLARATNAVGRVQANMLMTRMKEKDFILTGSEQDKKEFDTYWQKTQQFMTETEADIVDPKDIKTIKELDSSLKSYVQGFEKVVTFKKQRNELVNNVLNTKGPEIEKILTKIQLSAKEDGNISASYNTALSMRSLLLARLYVLKFLESNSQDSVDRVNKEFMDLDTELKVLNTELQDPAQRALLSTALEDITTYKQAFDRVVTVILDRNTIISGTLNPARLRCHESHRRPETIHQKCPRPTWT